MKYSSHIITYMYISKEAELLVLLIVNHNFAMTNIARTQFQSHPFHMVEPSPWPLLTAFALLTLTVSGVLYLSLIHI